MNASIKKTYAIEREDNDNNTKENNKKSSNNDTYRFNFVGIENWSCNWDQIILIVILNTEIMTIQLLMKTNINIVHWCLNIL